MVAEAIRSARNSAWPALFVCACAICGLILRAGEAGGRLYWEYAGRLLHRPVTNGYIEWVQHRVGDPPAVETALLLSANAAPYSGFSAEYPPGALLLFAAVRSMHDSLNRFDFAFMLIMAFIAFLAALAGWRLRAQIMLPGAADPMPHRLAALGFVALWPLLAGRFAVIRFDVVPAALVAGGLLLAVRGRSTWGALLLGLGAAIKLWPGLLLPLLLANLWFSGKRSAAVLAGLAGVGGFLLPHLLMLALGTAPADLFAYLGYLGERPAQVESLVANLLVVWAHVTGVPVSHAFDFGSHNIDVSGAAGWIRSASLLNAGLLIGLFALVCRQTQRARSAQEQGHVLVAACAAAIGITMLCSRVFSGEYVLWLVPLVIALSGSRSGVIGLALLSLALIALKATYYFYPLVTAGSLEGALVSLVKNLLILATALTFTLLMMRRDSRLVLAGK